MKTKAIYVLFGILWCTVSQLDAQTSLKLLPFQGRLTDQNGVAVSNGVRLVQFKIYDVPTGGSPIWAGELHRTTVNGGLVNVLLGSKTPFTGVNFDQQLYLEITVDINGDNSITLADPPMLPRQAILPVVFAKEAADSRLLDGYDWSALFGTNNPAGGTLLDSKIQDGSLSAAKIAPQAITDDKLAAGIAVPIGGVIMWWGSTSSVPVNFELCDGGAPTTPGATLAGNKPDLRDRFVKGAQANATNVKSSPVVGGTHSLNLSHDHEMDHIHGSDNLYVPINLGYANAISFGAIGGGHHAARNSFSSGYGLITAATRATSPDEQANQKTATAVFGTTATASRQYTAQARPATGNFATIENRPAFLEMFFIIRVK